ncbi:MAG: bifunctional diaminohydroxyphosphoribosylaminopyrimidine deaminase/5-amino-6-(5-phosphoribosylamino)uracil reductase RibD [Mameliella sp.]|nr:bifunctional diaminohydroxyphosphoribosylaminopyrimidine deaminase/5-amino-6-(5-phosphoribosylamino)uracil reductase RibD [Phaeodactylibacter sp.]
MPLVEDRDELYMQRCFDLARLGAGATAPNPMVGAVIVYNGRIIGEGYHQAYGQAHAEVNAVNSVSPEDRGFLTSATIYVSLEPCNIFGKTPPCTNLILKEGIPRVVVSSVDRTPGVDGSGLQRLRDAGVNVTVGVLKKEGDQLSQIRNTFVTGHRPYIILKYAQSANGIFAPEENQQLWLTSKFSKRLVHKWRSEVSAIMVGANTALADDPQLNNRLFFGRSPVRVLMDRKGNLPASLKLFSDGSPTLLFRKPGLPDITDLSSAVQVLPLKEEGNELNDILAHLYEMKLSTLIVEGGILTLQEFIKRELWDEALVLTADKTLSSGRQAPVLPEVPAAGFPIGTDKLEQYFRTPIR